LSLLDGDLMSELAVPRPRQDLDHSSDKTATTRQVWKQNMLNSLTDPGLSLPSRVTCQRRFRHYNLKIRLVSSHQLERAIELLSRLRHGHLRNAGSRLPQPQTDVNEKNRFHPKPHTRDIRGGSQATDALLKNIGGPE